MPLKKSDGDNDLALFGYKLEILVQDLFISVPTVNVKKNHILFLHDGARTVSYHDDKAEVLKDHFNSLLGKAVPTCESMNWDFINMPRDDLRHLDRPFDMDELNTAIKEIAPKKAPSPDGFIGMFFKCC